MKPGESRASPVKSSSRPAMIFSSDDLPDAVGAEHADLGAGVERQRDVLQDLAVGRVEAADLVHGEDELGTHAAQTLPTPPSRSGMLAGAGVAGAPCVENDECPAAWAGRSSGCFGAVGQRLRAAGALLGRGLAGAVPSWPAPSWPLPCVGRSLLGRGLLGGGLLGRRLLGPVPSWRDCLLGRRLLRHRLLGRGLLGGSLLGCGPSWRGPSWPPPSWLEPSWLLPSWLEPSLLVSPAPPRRDRLHGEVVSVHNR